MKMINNITVKTYKNIPLNLKEILRYAGCPKTEKPRLLDECIEEIRGKLSYKVCWGEFEICIDESLVDFGFAKAESAALAKNLRGCKEILLFAATVGIEIDRLITKYGRLSPTKALLFQAIGAERIESLCDAFCDEMSELLKKDNRFLRPRFSPGYGDLPLMLQKDIFEVLSCPKRIGVTLNDSLLMSPSKSVTAIVGISDRCGNADKSKCETCENLDCAYRG